MNDRYDVVIGFIINDMVFNKGKIVHSQILSDIEISELLELGYIKKHSPKKQKKKTFNIGELVRVSNPIKEGIITSAEYDFKKESWIYTVESISHLLPSNMSKLPRISKTKHIESELIKIDEVVMTVKINNENKLLKLNISK